MDSLFDWEKLVNPEISTETLLIKSISYIRHQHRQRAYRPFPFLAVCGCLGILSTTAEVYLWGTRVGIIHQEPDKPYASFEYDADFLKSGIEISPIMMPLSDIVYEFPLLSGEPFFGMLTDMLEVGKKMGIRKRKCMEIISRISKVVADFEKYAIEARIREKTYSDIRNVLDQNKIEI